MTRSLLVIFATLVGGATIASNVSAQARPVSAPPAACCTVTAVDLQNGMASAKVNATGAPFAFKVTDVKLLQTLRVGAGVYANFAAHQVSLNGRDACCEITTGAEGELLPKTRGPATASRTTALTVVTVSAGPPQQQALPARSTAARPRAESRTLTTTSNGKSSTANVMHLRGLDGIEAAQGLPDGVKEILMMHVKTLGAEQSDHYLINVDLANEWAKTHPVSASVKQAAQESDSHTGCHSFSMHCAGEAGKHAEGQADALINDAKKDWSHAATQLGHDWDVAADQVEACFADHATNAIDLPIDFSVSLPSLTTLGKTVNFDSASKGGQSSGQGSSGKQGSSVSVTVAGQPVPGTSASPPAAAAGPLTNGIKGGLVFGIPNLSTKGTVTHVDFFYIPCLPFVLRPRSLGATGTMAVETSINANLEIDGTYSHKYTIPPVDIKYPLYVYPIMAGVVPIGTVDYAVFIQGFLDVSGTGKVTDNLSLDNSHTTTFDYTCDGKGCTWRSQSEPQITKKSSDTDNGSATGRIDVQPKIFTGISLDVDYDAFSVRSGPEPTMDGDVIGAACVSAGQKVTTAEALMTELDWAPAFRVDVLVAEQPQGDGYNQTLTKRLVSYNDLVPGGSSALIPAVSGPPKAKPGNAEGYTVKMPDCYPYTEAVTVSLTWTGTVTPSTSTPGSAPGTKACNFTAGQATCVMDPKKGLSLAFAWSAPGSYTITAVAVKDAFGREFKTSRPGTVAVAVGT